VAVDAPEYSGSLPGVISTSGISVGIVGLGSLPDAFAAAEAANDNLLNSFEVAYQVPTKTVGIAAEAASACSFSEAEVSRTLDSTEDKLKAKLQEYEVRAITVDLSVPGQGIHDSKG